LAIIVLAINGSDPRFQSACSKKSEIRFQKSDFRHCGDHIRNLQSGFGDLGALPFLIPRKLLHGRMLK